MVEYVERTVKVPKQANEVSALLVLLVKDIKAKKPVSEILTDTLPALAKAVEGVSALGDEAKDAAIYNLGGLLVSDLVAAFALSATAAVAQVEAPQGSASEVVS